MLLEIIAFSLFVLLFTLLGINNIIVRTKNRKLTKEAFQLNTDKLMLLEKLERLVHEKDSSDLEKTDGFLRFISESRDWAFEYIENVQKSIQELVIAMKQKDDNGIERAFNSLKDFLPDEEENIKNNNKEKND